MIPPLISCLCVTFGRIPQLEEAIACFEAREFKDSELIILNTFPKQTLEYGGSSRVRLINLTERPKSLSEARNLAVDLADGKIIVTHDDDCIYLPNHLSNFAKRFVTGVDWVWFDRMLFMENSKLTKIAQASENTLAFTKDAWKRVGGYQEGMSVGEDRQFAGRLTAQCKGQLIRTATEDFTFLYGWGTDAAYHLSGHGWEKEGQTAYEKVRQTVEERATLGLIPTGKILLKPQLKHDYVGMAQAFLAKSTATVSDDDVCIVQLGRLGDIINALPIAKHIFDTTGNKPFWMIAREFAHILEGVSYVRPYPVDLTFHQLNEAMILANTTFPRVIKTQIYGHNHRQETLTSCWPQESWRQAGCLPHYHDKQFWRLIFDQRSPEREARLAAKLFRTSKPKIITNLTAAISVPFPQGDKFLSALQLEFGKRYEIVDIGKLHAERIYDLLGLYDRADIIVSIDTATMHLAAAAEVPVVALVNPSHWLGPYLRYNCAARIPYSAATIRTVCDAVAQAPAWMNKSRGRDAAVRILSTPVKESSPSRLNLPQVCLWACAWSDDENNLLRTLRVLRYCSSVINFGEVVMFSYLPLPEKLGFACRQIQIPPLSPESWNIFHCHTLPHMLPKQFKHYMSVHEDGMPLNIEKWYQDFLSYDYIGAVWPDGVVGNGGFTIESKAFLDAKTSLPFMQRLSVPVGTTFGMLHFTPSDDYVCRDHRATLESKGMKFAPRWVASQFSTEAVDKEVESFGWHGRHADPIKYAKAWDLITESEK